MLNNWHKKEKPIQGMMGMGGGATGSLVGGGGAVAESSGGIIHTPGNGYTYHVFTYPNSDDFVAGQDINNSVIDLLLIGGGGSGASYYGAGGGAGGVVKWTGAPVVAGNTYTMTVGAGGITAPPGTNDGNSGGNSTFTGLAVGTITALGGGAGLSAGNPGSKGPKGDGGSGGGSGSVPQSTFGGRGLQPGLNTPAQGQSGFNQYGNHGGDYNVASTGYAPAGGGGAGGAGSNGFQSTGAAAAGHGIPILEFPGPAIPTLSPVVPRMGPNYTYYGGGGGAGGYSTGGSAGGYGGGGNGHPRSGTNSVNAKGADMLGGGGGGRHPNANNSLPTAGGNGICIIRYQPV